MPGAGEARDGNSARVTPCCGSRSRPLACVHASDSGLCDSLCPLWLRISERDARANARVAQRRVRSARAQCPCNALGGAAVPLILWFPQLRTNARVAQRRVRVPVRELCGSLPSAPKMTTAALGGCASTRLCGYCAIDDVGPPGLRGPWLGFCSSFFAFGSFEVPLRRYSVTGLYVRIHLSFFTTEPFL